MERVKSAYTKVIKYLNESLLYVVTIL